MQTEIEQQLQKVIGMPLLYIGRASNMLWSGFGTRRVVQDRRGRQREVGDYAIHIQCSWRIATKSKILVANHDFYVPNSTWDGEYEDFDWDVQGQNLFDERIKQLFPPDSHPLVVKHVQADALGGFKMTFHNDFVLEVFPHSSDDSEHWRMFVPAAEGDHFVISNEGIGI